MCNNIYKTLLLSFLFSGLIYSAEIVCLDHFPDEGRLLDLCAPYPPHGDFLYDAPPVVWHYKNDNAHSETIDLAHVAYRGHPPTFFVEAHDNLSYFPTILNLTQHDDSSSATSADTVKRTLPSEPKPAKKRAIIPKGTSENGLSKARIEALLATRQGHRWVDGEALLSREAQSLGIKKEVLHGALLRIKARVKPTKTYKDLSALSKEEIAIYNQLHLKETRIQTNCHILADMGLIRETCEAKALELGVPFADLYAYHTHLVHNCELHTGYVDLSAAAVKAFIENR